MTTSIRFRIYHQHQLSDISWKKERTDGENNSIIISTPTCQTKSHQWLEVSDFQISHSVSHQALLIPNNTGFDDPCCSLPFAVSAVHHGVGDRGFCLLCHRAGNYGAAAGFSGRSEIDGLGLVDQSLRTAADCSLLG